MRGADRESSYELLRIWCILGILAMHAFGSIRFEVTGWNLVYGTLLNSLCNAGVTIFVLISGYYGMRSKGGRKIVSLELTTIFYALLTCLASWLMTGDVTIKDVIPCLTPISARYSWFMTAYMIMLIFADYINMIPERLSQQTYQRLLLMMLAVFSIVPTVTRLHVMDDSGKGVLNMLLAYLIGRYIRIYHVELKRYMALGMAVAVFAAESILNYACAIHNGSVGIYALFALDYSIFIIALSVCIFLFFRTIHMQSDVVNGIARNIIGIYLFEGTLRAIIGQYLRIEDYIDRWYLFAVNIGIAIGAFAIGTVIETIRRNTIGRVEEPIYLVLKGCWQRSVAVMQHRG